MLYAQVVVGLPVEGPFDYIVPAQLKEKIKVGVRVSVPFRKQRLIGYVVGLKRRTSIKNLKTIAELLDLSPIIDKNLLLLTQGLAGYYCCSWGEAIETALPSSLRKGRALKQLSADSDDNFKTVKHKDKFSRPEILLLHDISKNKRWDIYIPAIKDALAKDKSVIILLPDVSLVYRTKELISSCVSSPAAILYRRGAQELAEWLKVKNKETNLIIGTRSAIFAPTKNLGLIIIDEEQNPVYKQDQVPHYHARTIALQRAKLEGARVILGSTSPALESFYLVKKAKINPSTMFRIDAESFDYAQDGSPKDGEIVEPRSRSIKYEFIVPEKKIPEIKIIDTRRMPFRYKRRPVILTKYLEDAIAETINLKGRVLVFLNRKGFATFASCQHCGIILKCPRCNINLVYHFKGNILSCHYCNYKMPPPNICPACNSGYIRYSGAGTEKIESELSRIFPQSRIKRIDGARDVALSCGDIFIATESVIKETNLQFELVAVLGIDNSLNRVDFRSSEKVFGLLVGLLHLSEEKIIIQTALIQQHCFKALQNRDMQFFYAEELRQRRQLGLAPYKHLGLVKLRGRKEERLKELSRSLFNKLLQAKREKNIEVVSLNPGQPPKLRDNFYWQILLKANDTLKMSSFLKKCLKDFSSSGIIVTVDIDPL